MVFALSLHVCADSLVVPQLSPMHGWSICVSGISVDMACDELAACDLALIQ